MPRLTDLPPYFLPRLLSRNLAAAYLQISTTKFDELVRDGRMPRPKCIDSRRVFDRLELDRAIDELPVDGEQAQNPWDEP